MQRTKINKKVDAILCADFHLRESTPICYIGDFEKEQWDCLAFIKDLQKKYDCPVLHAGDLFDHWKPSPYLLTLIIKKLPKNFYTVYGNTHDVPQNCLNLVNKCGINTLEAAKSLTILPGAHWGQQPCISYIIKNKKILVWHVMTYQGRKPFPGITDSPARNLLRKYKEFDLIVTGHNHQAFIETYNNRLLVNPGSLTRQEAGQIDFKPRVYLWHADTNTVTPVYLPIQEGVISQEHIQVKEKRENRIDAFISRLDEDWESTMDFEQNLESFKQVNEIKPEIMDIVYFATEIIKN